MAINKIQVIKQNGQTKSDDIMAKYLGNNDTDNYTYDTLNAALALKAPLASPRLTGQPTAPTAAAGTNTTQIANTAFVTDAISRAVGNLNDAIGTFAGAMIFKGTIGTSGATVTSLPANHEVGWTYKVITANIYAGVTCEVGDMITCIKAGTTAKNADWTVYQANIEGEVIGPVKSNNDTVVLFDGTTGKLVKDSGFTISKSVPSDAVFTDTTYTAGDGLVLNGTEFYLQNTGVTPDSYGPNAQTLKFGGSIKIPQFNLDAQGRITTIAENTIGLPKLAMPVNPTATEVAAMPDGAFYLVY